MTRFALAFALIAAAPTLGGCGFSDSALWHSAAPGPAKADAPPPAAEAAKPPQAAEAANPLQAAAAPSAAASPPQETRKPFVVIRFERPDPDYGAALYDALSGALARRPGAGFDLVAVTRDPDAAERNLASVLHTVTAMGMPADRLSLSVAAAADDATDEVWFYLR